MLWCEHLNYIGSIFTPSGLVKQIVSDIVKQIVLDIDTMSENNFDLYLFAIKIYKYSQYILYE